MSFGDIQKAAQAQQPPSAGANMTFGPQATEQGGLLQRQLQPGPEMQAGGPLKFHAVQQAANWMSNHPQVAQGIPIGGGAAMLPTNTQDPNLMATMQGLQGLLADSKQKKAEFAKSMMGGG